MRALGDGLKLASRAIPGGSVVARQARRTARALAVAATMAATMAATASGASARFDAGVRIDPRNVGGGVIAERFVGVSLEWTLTDRYMGPTSRTAFANLLGNLGSGVLRVGGSSRAP
jgi:hypothetical protein